MNKKWDAQGYESEFKFVHKYGEDVLDLLDVKEGQHILDIGCGNAVLTKKIHDMGAIVTAIDSSKEMLDLAKKNYPELNLNYMDASNFKFEEKFDSVFSNAVFHWIDNQKGLIQSISSALKEQGHLICEFGGAGCCEQIHLELNKSFIKRGLKYKKTFYFPTIGEYTPQLESEGLIVEYASLFERPTKLNGENGMADWIEMFIAQSFSGIDESIKNEIISEVVENLRPTLYKEDGWYADYVRIRIKAVKSSKNL